MTVAADPLKHTAWLIAFWHGQKITHIKPGDGAMTVAALNGYGKFGDAADRYAAARWEEYKAAAKAVILDVAQRRRKSKGFRRHLRRIKRGAPI